MLDAASQELFDRPLGLSEAALKQALDPWANVTVRRVTGALRGLLALPERIIHRDGG